MRRLPPALMCPLGKAPAIVALASTPGLAQGNLGGAVGKRDRAIAGDTAKPPARTANKPRQIGKAPCRRIGGTWTWIVGTVAVFETNGSARHVGISTATWSCKDAAVVATWSNGYIDSISIPDDAKRLSVTNNAGNSFVATRRQ